MSRLEAAGGWAARATLMAAAVAVYARTLQAGFVFLDGPAILENPTIRHPHPFWRALVPPAIPGVTVQGRPLVNLSLALNYAVGGTNPMGYHAFNVAVHAACALAVFGLTWRTLALRGVEAPRFWGWVVALLWAVHPLCTEAVAYAVQRAESMMALFYLGTLLAFVFGAEGSGRPIGGVSDPGYSQAAEPGERRGWLVVSWLACLAGMATKEVMVSAPVIVLLYDSIFIAGSLRAAWERRRVYYLSLAATWIPLAWLVKSTGGDRGGTAGFDLGISASRYWITQGPAIWHYLRLAVWPHPLIFFYEVRWTSLAGAALPLAGIALLLGATAWGVWRPSRAGVSDPGYSAGVPAGSVVEAASSRLFLANQAAGRRFYSPNRRAAAFCAAFFFAVLAPTSVIPGLTQTVAEHRMYLALVPVLALVVLAGRALAARRRRALAAWAGLCLVGAAAGAAATVRRTAVYANELALWTDTVAKAPGNPYSRNNLALALVGAHRDEDAAAQLQKVVAERPGYAEAHDNLGLVLARLGRLDDAVAQYRIALQLRPGNSAARTNLGVALVRLGRYDQAVSELTRAVADDPHYLAARNDLAAVLAGVGRLEDAIAQYRQILQQAPPSAETRYNFGTVLARAGRWEEAADSFRNAAELAPGNADALSNLGVALAQLGRNAEAVAADEAALRLAPGDNDVRRNLELARRALAGAHP